MFVVLSMLFVLILLSVFYSYGSSALCFVVSFAEGLLSRLVCCLIVDYFSMLFCFLFAWGVV